MNRRIFLKRAASATPLAALFSGLPPGWVGTAYASDAPETPNVRFGIIALTDCASIVMAHELGYFKQFGITGSVVSKEASWAVIRDKLSLGENQATHMLIGMPFASTMGLLGSPVKPMIAPWMINRNGQGISLGNRFKGVVKWSAKELKPFVDKAKASGTPMTFAMTFPPGTHAIWLRYWLGAGGIHPDKDVNLITIPPPQMVANMKVDKMDGFCVGEPWNARTIIDGVGYSATSTQKLWPDHPEKVCAFTEEFASRNPKTVTAVLKALHLSSQYIDKMENRPHVAEVISRPAYINTPKEVILDRMLGRYDYGDGRKEQDPNYMIFSQRGCNFPSRTFGYWWLTQFRRWGMVKGAPQYRQVAERVMRPDLYLAAMKEMGVKVTATDLAPAKLTDGVFDPANAEKYATSFAVHSLQEA
jgi:nitrate/nitrite transport system substrate-binding protein